MKDSAICLEFWNGDQIQVVGMRRDGSVSINMYTQTDGDRLNAIKGTTVCQISVSRMLGDKLVLERVGSLEFDGTMEEFFHAMAHLITAEDGFDYVMSQIEPDYEFDSDVEPAVENVFDIQNVHRYYH